MYKITLRLFVATMLTVSAFAVNAAFAEENESTGDAAKELMQRLAEDLNELREKLTTEISKLHEKITREPEPDSSIETRIYKLKHISAKSAFSLLSIYYVMEYNEDLNALIVNGSPEMLMSFEKAIKELDVPIPPEKNVEIRNFLIIASDQDVQNGQDIPEEFTEAIIELKALFQFKTYRLLDASFIRCRDGQSAELFGNNSMGTISFRTKTVTVNSSIDTISFNRFSYSVGNVGFLTDLNVKSGQTVLVGKATPDSDDITYFLAVTAKIVD